MLAITEIGANDVLAARYLCALTTSQLADLADLSVSTIERSERGQDVQEGTRIKVRTALAYAGVQFVDHRDVRHIDGRRAPTHEAVGTMRGDRLARARRKLGLAPWRVAGMAHLTCGALARIELHQLDLTQGPTAGFYRLVGVLQLAGMAFAPMRHGGLSGDMLTVTPPSRVREPKDRSRYHTKGMRVPGMTLRSLEDPDIDS